MDAKLLKDVEQCEKLYHIHGRVEVDEDTGKSRRVARMRRKYLDLVNEKHKKAPTRVLLSGHMMAVKIWQYAKTWQRRPLTPMIASVDMGVEWSRRPNIYGCSVWDRKSSSMLTKLCGRPSPCCAPERSLQRLSN